jgi:hypothetical protein
MTRERGGHWYNTPTDKDNEGASQSTGASAWNRRAGSTMDQSSTQSSTMGQGSGSQNQGLKPDQFSSGAASTQTKSSAFDQSDNDLKSQGHLNKDSETQAMYGSEPSGYQKYQDQSQNETVVDKAIGIGEKAGQKAKEWANSAKETLKDWSSTDSKSNTKTNESSTWENIKDKVKEKVADTAASADKSVRSSWDKKSSEQRTRDQDLTKDKVGNPSSARNF